MQRNHKKNHSYNFFRNSFFFIMILTSMHLEALIHETSIEQFDADIKQPKYQLSICSIFKNEAKHLKEWIEYHLIFGVDHFYLYNIGSKDYFEDILHPYVKDGVITLINWPEAISLQENKNAFRWALSTQIPAYENAVNFIAKNETRWMVILDINEFLVCPQKDINIILHEYDDYSAITFPSDCFDAAINSLLPPQKLLIQSLEMTNPPMQIIDKSVKKMIFKPDQCKGFTWPPYQCKLNHPLNAVALSRQELKVNHYINRNKRYSGIGKPKLNVDNRVLSESMMSEYLKEGYIIEDQEKSIYQYIPELLKKLAERQSR